MSCNGQRDANLSKAHAGADTDTQRTLTEISRTLPAEDGGQAAGALLRRLDDEAGPKIREVLELAEQDTNTRAATLLATEGEPTRARLATYTG